VPVWITSCIIFGKPGTFCFLELETKEEARAFGWTEAGPGCKYLVDLTYLVLRGDVCVYRKSYWNPTTETKVCGSTHNIIIATCKANPEAIITWQVCLFVCVCVCIVLYFLCNCSAAFYGGSGKVYLEDAASKFLLWKSAKTSVTRLGSTPLMGYEWPRTWSSVKVSAPPTLTFDWLIDSVTGQSVNTTLTFDWLIDARVLLKHRWVHRL
jgi:hypothetical protein